MKVEPALMLGVAMLLMLHRDARAQEMPRAAPPVRQDFVALRPEPSPPPANERVATGPPIRRDFIGHDERPARPESTPQPPTRPPMRIDFEGPAVRPEAPGTMER